MEERLGAMTYNIKKKVPAYLIGLLSIMLIATYIFTLKSYEPAKNIILTGGIIIYPFSFLIISLISKYYGFVESRKAIFTSTLIYITFFLVIMIGILPISNPQTSSYNSVIQYLFANNSFNIGSLVIYYPILGLFFAVLISYLVSHLLFATIYNAVARFTIDYLAVGLSLFIAYIIDRIIFIPLFFADGLVSEYNSFDYLIKCLTSEFIAAIMITILLIVIYTIFTNIKNAIAKK